MDHPYLNVSDPVFTRRLHYTTYGVLAPLLVAAGLAGNLACLPVLAAPRRWGVTRLLLVALSAADCAVLVLLAPALARLRRPSAVVSGRALAWYAAHLEQPLLSAATAASVGATLVLTVDRYISVCRSSQFRSQHQRSVATRRLAAALVVSVALAVPAAFRGSAAAADGGWAVQQAAAAGWVAYTVVCECATRLLPMLVMVVLNWRIAVGLRQMAERTAARPPSMTRDASVASMVACGRQQGRRPGPDERALARLVVVILTCLLVCLLPGTVITLRLQSATDDSASRALDAATAAANLLEITNFSSNYVFYMIFNKRLRRSLFTFYRNLLSRGEHPITVNI